MMKMEEYTLKEMFSSGSGGSVSHKRCFLKFRTCWQKTKSGS